MKVYITQGHEKGIGLEVFFKTCLLLSPKERSLLSLIAYRDSVNSTLNSLNIPFVLNGDKILLCGESLEVIWLDKINHSQSLTALDLGMKLSEAGGVLFTLPTSKDQFLHHAGHTEYFREFYHRPNLGMFFSSPDLKVLLLSDHVAVSKLSELMTENYIYERLLEAVEALNKWSWPTKRILVAGLNPHAGESGMIGDEDKRVSQAIKRLLDTTKLDVAGPLPGDTMLLEQVSADDLLVYLFHDQGLGVFKGQQGFIGSNITLGLPYPRFSPDHGTSFKLFGKNQADYRGCAHALREAITLLNRISDGKNSSYQGQSS